MKVILILMLALTAGAQTKLTKIPQPKPLTEAQLHTAIDGYLAQVHKLQGLTADITKLTDKIEMATAMAELDGGKDLREIKSGMEAIMGKSIDAAVKTQGFTRDVRVFDAIKKYGHNKGNWAAVHAGAWTTKKPFRGEVSVPVAIVIYTGKKADKPTAAKISIKWVDMFGDEIGTNVHKVTKIVMLPAKSIPATRSTMHSWDNYTKVVGAMKPDYLIMPNATTALPSHAAKAGKATVEITAVKEVK